VLAPDEQGRRLNLGQLGAQVALPDVRDAVHEAHGARSRSVRDDRRDPPAHVVELLEQRQRSAEDASVARDAGRRDERQPPDVIRVLRGELRGEQAAERVCKHVDGAEPGGVDQPG